MKNFDNNIIPYDKDSIGYVPPWNFDDFWSSMIVVFIGLANDGWTTVFFDFCRAVGQGTTIFYFISWMWIG